MRILLTGGSGFIGSALARALGERGHDVVRVARGEGADLRADFASVPSRQWWAGKLRGFDAVVNAVGIIREQGGQAFKALHTEAPIELFNGCVAAGVQRVVQVSALGADEQARSRYHLTKKAADDALRALPLMHAIVQPSLVYGPQGNSAALFNGLAMAPLLMLPHRGAMSVQPVHVDDVVAGIVALLEAPELTGTFAFAGDRAMPMRDYLGVLRSGLGATSKLRILPLPEPLFRLGARVAGLRPGSMLDAETADMLLRGNETQDNALARLIHRALVPVQSFVPRGQQAAMRVQAILFWAAPMLRVSIAIVWLWTAAVSFGLYPVERSYELLARVGLHGSLASIALYGAAALDLAFGVLILLGTPALRRWLWPAQLALIAGYTVLITFFLPEYWLHPYGPILKNLPMMAAIGLLWALDTPARGRSA